MDSGIPDPTKGQAVWFVLGLPADSLLTNFLDMDSPKQIESLGSFQYHDSWFCSKRKGLSMRDVFPSLQKTYLPKKRTVCHRAIILLFPGKYQQNGWCSSQLCFFHTGVYHQTGKKNLSKGNHLAHGIPPLSPCPWPPQRWQQSCRSEKILPWQPMLQWKIGGPSNMNRLSPSSHVST